MKWNNLPESNHWAKIQYVEDRTIERIGSFKVRKYTFETDEERPVFAEGHTRVASDWAMMYLSTLSGCPVKCDMCGTNKSFSGKLSAKQMIEQITVMMDEMELSDKHTTKLIKWMYMGEPMLNSKNFIFALKKVLVDYPDWDHVISTVGPTVDFEPLFEVARKFGNRIEFTISIHGLSDLSRNLIIPFKRKHDLQGLISIGERWYQESGCKVSYSYNLCNSAGLDWEAEELTRLFDTDIWIPCIQYQHTISSDTVHLENRTNEELCDLADAGVDNFMAKLSSLGYEDVKGFYTNRDTIERGCGSLIEYQKFVTRQKVL